MGCCGSKPDTPGDAAQKALANEQAAVDAEATAAAAKAGSATVYAKMLDGESIPLQCEPSTTVGELKLKIHGAALAAVEVRPTEAAALEGLPPTRKGLPPDEQKLVLRTTSSGTECADDAATLASLVGGSMERYGSGGATFHIAMMDPEAAATMRREKYERKVREIEAERRRKAEAEAARKRAEAEARRAREAENARRRAEAEAAHRAQESSGGGDSASGGG